eukprot:CAMPEP_0183346384 /NCGR_PEP_ID=MMETSP0164_2-20130417/11529_1 /TAXON_ID=221442 /ORGANISM="Coccolithus pelagicus ssp braarudi, Strain PLY182g" /LENGTH=101 /DNA_ID=CAMNT_0025517655 /DNA_START=459 /DNA_END=760 /DNA_ORIENTATION=-
MRPRGLARSEACTSFKAAAVDRLARAHGTHVHREDQLAGSQSSRTRHGGAATPSCSVCACSASSSVASSLWSMGTRSHSRKLSIAVAESPSADAISTGGDR